MLRKLNGETAIKLSAILKFALDNPYSAFYRKKYLTLEFKKDVAIEKTFFDLPFLIKDELLDTPPFERLFSNPNSNLMATYTSGTSGKEPLIIFERNWTANQTGLNHLFPASHENSKFALIMLRPDFQWLRAVQLSEKVPVFAGNPYQMEETAIIAAKLEIDTISTTTSILLPFLNFLEKSYDLSKIRWVFLGSESLTPPLRETFHKKLRNAGFYQSYGSREGGRIGFQCDILSKKESFTYHVRSNKLLIEIIPIEKDRSNVGEIILTHLEPRPSLMIRYKTGDLGEWIDEKCECGLENPLIRLVGRKLLDKVKLNGIEFQISSFDSALKNISDYVKDEFTAHFYQKIINDKIVGEIMIDLAPKPDAKINIAVQTIIEEILSRDIRISSRFSFEDLVNQGLFLPIKINLLEPPKNQLKASITKKLVPHF